MVPIKEQRVRLETFREFSIWNPFRELKNLFQLMIDLDYAVAVAAFTGKLLSILVLLQAGLTIYKEDKIKPPAYRDNDYLPCYTP